MTGVQTCALPIRVLPGHRASDSARGRIERDFGHLKQRFEILNSCYRHKDTANLDGMINTIIRVCMALDDVHFGSTEEQNKIAAEYLIFMVNEPLPSRIDFEESDSDGSTLSSQLRRVKRRAEDHNADEDKRESPSERENDYSGVPNEPDVKAGDDMDESKLVETKDDEHVLIAVSSRSNDEGEEKWDNECSIRLVSHNRVREGEDDQIGAVFSLKTTKK